MLKIDELREPPIVGETYLVPCVLRDKWVTIHRKAPDLEWRVSLAGDLTYDCREEVHEKHYKELEVYPILNLLHHDRENGQDYFHYHVDYRFIELEKEFPNYPRPKKLHPYHTWAPNVRYDLKTVSNVDHKKDFRIEYHPLKCLRLQQRIIAGQVNQKALMHKCIVNGKCPHKGYDLSQEIPSAVGVITCPLHGLTFNAETKKLIGQQFVM